MRSHAVGHPRPCWPWLASRWHASGRWCAAWVCASCWCRSPRPPAPSSARQRSPKSSTERNSGMASHPSNTRHPRCIPLPRAGMLALALLAATAPVHAQQGDTTELATLRAELESLKAEEAERDARIQRIEEALLRLSGETTEIGRAHV